LCTLAEAVTLNAVPAAFVAGDDTATLSTLKSDERVTDVTAFFVAELLPDVGSVTCSWSTVAVAVTEIVWLDGFVHVTDQVNGLAGTVAAIDVTSDVFCTVCGFADEVVQSPGRLRVNSVSTFVGLLEPLL
jgi:hypothetical protein